MVRNWNEQNYIRKDKSSQKCCILPRTSEFSGGGKKFYLKQKKKSFLAATNQQNLKYLRLVDIPGEGIAST